MHSDVFLATGYSHMVCEDYILGNDTAVVLCDGCSSSSQTDVGARILAHTAMETVKHGFEPNDNKLIDNATDVALNFPGLQEEALDCTLSMCYVAKDRIHIILYSDGVFFYKDKNGNISFEVINFKDNTPFYLNYKNNPFRIASFRTLNPLLGVSISKTVTYCHRNYAKESEITGVNVANSELPVSDSFPLDEMEFVGIASDGILSFEKDAFEVLTELTSFKTTNGEFMKRRAKRFLKDNFHYDDLSIGVIML